MTDIIQEEEKQELEKDGYNIKYQPNNILTIRNKEAEDRLLAEIIPLEGMGEEKFVINTNGECHLANKIQAIVSAYGVLCIFFKTSSGENNQIMIETEN